MSETVTATGKVGTRSSGEEPIEQQAQKVLYVVPSGQGEWVGTVKKGR